MADAARTELGPRLDALYAAGGRPSLAPEKLLRALLLQALYTVRSERLLLEQLDYNFLFRWFVRLNIDDPVCDATVFSKNRERLLEGAIAERFFSAATASGAAIRPLSPPPIPRRGWQKRAPARRPSRTGWGPSTGSCPACRAACVSRSGRDRLYA